MTAVGVSVHENILDADPGRRRALMDRIDGAGLDHVTLGDHVSFHDGTGFDGLTTATVALATNDRLSALVGIYQLALRHPMTVARQVASIAQVAPGRLRLGVGAGGEDRREILNCGVDPATRGRRLDEALGVLRRLWTGEPFDHEGEFFQLEQAVVLPVPNPTVPLVVGGSSDAAIRRAGTLGDGWLGIFCSARRFAQTRERVVAAAADAGREGVPWFGLSVWCGLARDPQQAQAALGERMSALYRLEPDRFRNVAPAGTPQQVAEWLAPFLDAGLDSLSIIPAAASVEEGADLAAEVAEIIRARRFDGG